MDSFYSAYWTEFMAELRRQGKFPLGPKKAPQRNWIEWSCFGRTGFKLIASVGKKDGWICVNFGIDSHDQKHHFAPLSGKRNEINKDVGLELRWDRLDPEKSSTQAIMTKNGADVQNPKDWQNQHIWMLENLEKLYNGFHSHVRALHVD
jgi:hypothetical protein